MKTMSLNKADFLNKVANYETSPSEWKFLGERPAIIDFMLPGAVLARCCRPFLKNWQPNMQER